MTEIDTEAIRARAKSAHEWLLRDSREQNGDDWLPLSTRMIYTRDVPALLDAIATLREVVGTVRALCTEIRADSIIGTSPEARLRLIGQVVDAVGKQSGGETLGLAEEAALPQAIYVGVGSHGGTIQMWCGYCRSPILESGHRATTPYLQSLAQYARDHRTHICPDPNGPFAAIWAPASAGLARRADAIPAPEPCPFDDCRTGPLGRDQLNAHIQQQHPDARAGQSVLGGDDPREAN